MRNQYRSFLNQLRPQSNGKGYEVALPEILIIGDPAHPLVVPRPFAPDEADKWYAKYKDLVRPGYSPDPQSTNENDSGHIQKIHTLAR